MKKNRTLKVLSNTNRHLQSHSFEIYLKLLGKLCKAHQSWAPSHDLKRLLGAKDYDGVLDWADSLSSQMYDDANKHFLANQFAALIRKYPWGERVTASPRDTAKSKFLKAERLCRFTNERLRLWRTRRKQRDYVQEIHSARSFVQYVLGDEPKWSSILDACNFGPGAAIGIAGSASNASRKLLAEQWTVTPSAFAHAYSSVLSHAQFRELLYVATGEACENSRGVYLFGSHQRFKHKTRVTKHNKISFVPKTARVHRTIAIEPLLNGFVQKGVDVYMRRKLLRVGLDLSDQSLNQRMARKGSLDDSLDGFVTIDLSAASDSVSLEVVRELLPPEWFDLLNSLRSHEYELDNTVNVYNKFCSMGNGFCFPLETLIFAAACSAVGAGRPGIDFSVYGDDIIVKKRYADRLVSFLSFLGFRTNADKTFLSGPFRESCGADWFSGSDVRPTTLDFELDSVQSLFKLLNLSLRSERTKLFFWDVRPFLIGHIPEPLRFYRPFKGNADSGIDSVGDEHLTSPHCTFSRRYQCWSCTELVTTAVSDFYFQRWSWGHIALLWGALSGAASDAPFAVRSKTRTKIRSNTYSGATSLWTPGAPLLR